MVNLACHARATAHACVLLTPIGSNWAQADKVALDTDSFVETGDTKTRDKFKQSEAGAAKQVLPCTRDDERTNELARTHT